MNIELALMTGVDIPIPECQIAVHQPTIREISMIGEAEFFIAAQLLCINKYSLEESIDITNITNFHILISILNEDKEKKDLVLNLLTLLFPNYNVIFTPRALVLVRDGVTITVDECVFDPLQNVLRQVFCLQQRGADSFNPEGDKAKEIANKLLRARQRVAAQKSKREGESSLAQYLSVLTVAIASMSLQNAIELTIYQLYNLLERYGMYVNWDLDIKARLAGAKIDKKPDNWMKPF